MKYAQIIASIFACLIPTFCAAQQVSRILLTNRTVFPVKVVVAYDAVCDDTRDSDTFSFTLPSLGTVDISGKPSGANSCELKIFSIKATIIVEDKNGGITEISRTFYPDTTKNKTLYIDSLYTKSIELSSQILSIK